MAETLQADAPTLSAGRSALRRLAELAGHLGQELELKDFRTGHWFNRLVALYLRHYEAHGLRHATEAIIHRACLEAALSGTGSAEDITDNRIAVPGGPGAKDGRHLPRPRRQWAKTVECATFLR